MPELDLYKSTSKTKMPDDGFIEAECSRFKSSRKDFGITQLTEINRWFGITPALQFEVFKKEENLKQMQEDWQKRMNDALLAKFEKKEGVCPPVPEEFTDLLIKIKEFIPDRHPGRLPTVSISDPEGGIWVSSWAKSVSSMQPIFIPTVRFDETPPVVYYQIPENVNDYNEPSIDSATHAYFFAGIEVLGAALSMPIKTKDKDAPSMITDGNVPLNDISVADFIFGQIIDERLWENRDNVPFIAAFGGVNSLVLATEIEQIEQLLDSGVFAQFD